MAHDRSPQQPLRQHQSRSYKPPLAAATGIRTHEYVQVPGPEIWIGFFVRTSTIYIYFSELP
jgi:hypothetical protein